MSEYFEERSIWEKKDLLLFDDTQILCMVQFYLLPPPPLGQPRGQVLPFGPGGGELSLSACPGVGNRPPSESKIANARGYARGGGMVTGRIEPCIKLPHLSSRQFIATIRSFIQRFIRTKLRTIMAINIEVYFMQQNL